MKVLLLAGTEEARQIALALRGMDAMVALAGATETPAGYCLPVRNGGFGGAAGLEDFLRRGGFTHLIDATHPFAATMKANAAVACAGAGVAGIHLIRPGWGVAFGGEQVADLPEAAAALTPVGRAFLALGARHLFAFRARTDVVLFARAIDPQPPEAGISFVTGRPPFAVEAEEDLFRKLWIDTLVSRDSGGTSGTAKLIAARNLGLRVILVARPAPPSGLVVDGVQAVLDWLGTGGRNGRAHH